MSLNVNNMIERVEHGNISGHKNSPMTWGIIQVFLDVVHELFNDQNLKYLGKGMN